MRELTCAINSKNRILFDKEGYEKTCGKLDEVNRLLLEIRSDIEKAGYPTNEETLFGVFFAPETYLADRAAKEYREWAINSECPPFLIADIESRARDSVNISLVEGLVGHVRRIYEVLRETGYNSELAKEDLTIKEGVFRLANSFKFKIRKGFETDVPDSVLEYATTMKSIVSDLRKMRRSNINPSLVLDQLLGGVQAPCDASDLEISTIVDLMIPEGRPNTLAELAYIGRMRNASGMFAK